MLLYLGTIDALYKALAKYRGKLEKVYRKVLGPELYDTVCLAEEEYLDNFSFFDDVRQTINGVSADSATNRFIHLTGGDVNFDTDGHYVTRSTTTAVGFCLNRKTIDRSMGRLCPAVPNSIREYVHWYNYFVLWAIQERPMFQAIDLIRTLVEPTRLPLAPKDIFALALSDIELELKRTEIDLAFWSIALKRTIDTSVLALDAEIFSRVFGKVSPDYFVSLPQDLVCTFIPFRENTCLEGVELAMEAIDEGDLDSFIDWLDRRGNTLNITNMGDDFYGKSLGVRLDTLSEWDSRYLPNSRPVTNFLESLREMSFRRVPVTELIDSVW